MEHYDRQDMGGRLQDAWPVQKDRRYVTIDESGREGALPKYLSGIDS